MRTDRNQGWDKDGNLVYDQQVQVDDTVEVNDRTLRQQVIGHMVANRNFRAAAKPATAAAQASAAYDAAVREAAHLNALSRLVLQLLDGTD